MDRWRGRKLMLGQKTRNRTQLLMHAWLAGDWLLCPRWFSSP
jgi:hypothetical protein